MTPRVGVFGYLSIDTLIHDNRAYDGVPGGAALYAALAVIAAGGTPILHATRGQDFPKHVLSSISTLGADLSAVRDGDGPSRRTRIAYGVGESRTSDHYADPDWWERTEALLPPLPSTVLDAAVMTPMPPGHAARISAAVADGTPIVADTSEAFAGRSPQALLDLLPSISVFVPSTSETRLLVPRVDDDAAARTLAARGCAVIQKRGPDGLVWADRTGIVARRAAQAAAVVDPTGAGDTVAGAVATALARESSPEAILAFAVDIAAMTIGAPGPAGLGLDPGPFRGEKTQTCMSR